MTHSTESFSLFLRFLLLQPGLRLENLAASLPNEVMTLQSSVFCTKAHLTKLILGLRLLSQHNGLNDIQQNRTSFGDTKHIFSYYNTNYLAINNIRSAKGHQ